MKPTRNEMEYAVGPFRSQQVAPVGPYLLSRQIRIGNVSACFCQETVVESYNWGRNFSLLFFRQFNSMLSTGTTTFDTRSTLWTACPESSCSCFSLLVRFLWIISNVGIPSTQVFFIFFVSHFDICTRFHHWFEVITNGCYISIQSFRCI